MFGGQDKDSDNDQTPQGNPPPNAAAPPNDSALSGVDDLVDNNGGGMPAADNAVSGLMPAPGQPVQIGNDPMSFSTTGDENDLIDLKQKALQQLSPLLNHLNQTPEEKFRTTMMMIQASDNKDLLKDAYAAAQAIPDERVKAQALLDVVNEINYFTQNKPGPIS